MNGYFRTAKALEKDHKPLILPIAAYCAADVTGKSACAARSKREVSM
jgi:hypothetical protein